MAKCPPGYSWWPREKRCKPNKSYAKYHPPQVSGTGAGGAAAQDLASSSSPVVDTAGAASSSPVVDTAGAASGTASGIPPAATSQISSGTSSPSDAVYSTGTGPVMPLAYALSTSYQEAVAQGSVPSTGVPPASGSTG